MGPTCSAGPESCRCMHVRQIQAVAPLFKTPTLELIDAATSSNSKLSGCSSKQRARSASPVA